MAFIVDDVLFILLTAVFVFWEPKAQTKKDNDYYKTNVASLPTAFRLPRIAFPMVWGFIKLCDIASIYLFFKFISNNIDNWTIPVAFCIFFAVQVISKTWSSVFFGMRWLGFAFGISVTILALQIFYMILIIVAQFPGAVFGDQWYLPFIFCLPRLLWLGFASILGYVWFARVGGSEKASRNGDYRRARDE